MVPLLRTLTFFVLFWLYQLLIIPLLLVRIQQEKRQPGPETWKRIAPQTRFWGRLSCRWGGARVTVEDRSGLAPEETALLVSNHQGDFDIPVLLGFAGRPVAFVAKKELAKIPLVSPWMRLMGCIFLDRDDRRKQVSQIRQTVDQLKQGLSMVIFPEGTRSRGGPMKPFAAGSLNIAEKAGVSILPVTLVDTYKLLPKGKIGMPGAEVKVILHPALHPSALSKEEKSGLHERVFAIVQSGLGQEVQDHPNGYPEKGSQGCEG